MTYTHAIHPVVRAALESWKASGERTAERLDRLVLHWGTVYGYTPDQIKGLALDAQKEAR